MKDAMDEQRDIDTLLRSCGRAWREQDVSPAAPTLDTLERIDAAPQSRKFHLPTAVPALAVAVAVLVLGSSIAFTMHHLTGGPRLAAGSTGGTLGCSASAFAADLGQPSHAEATGTRVAVDVTYTGAEPCTISGSGPEIQIIARDGSVLVEGGQLVTAAAANITVSPGQHVKFDIVWSSWCGSPYDAATVRLNLQGLLPEWWITAHGELAGADAPGCQNGRSVVQSSILTRSW